jgi:hypothetical protein
VIVKIIWILPLRVLIAPYKLVEGRQWLSTFLPCVLVGGGERTRDHRGSVVPKVAHLSLKFLSNLLFDLLKESMMAKIIQFLTKTILHTLLINKERDALRSGTTLGLVAP